MLALILFLLAARVAGQGADWNARLDAAEGADDVAAIETLVEELRPSASEGRAADRAMGKAWVRGTRLLVDASADRLARPRTFEERGEEARAAAEAYGDANDRLRVESSLGLALLAAGRTAEGRRTLEAGREHFPEARDVLPEVLMRLGQLAVRREALEDVDALADEALGRLDLLLRAETGANATSVLRRASFTTVASLCHSLKGHAARELGLIDVAAVEFLRASELAGGDPVSLIQSCLDRTDLAHALDDYDEALRLVDPLLAGAIELVGAEPGQLLLRRGAARAELARIRPELAARAEEEFAAARSVSGLRPAELRTIDLALAELATRTGRWAEAEEHLERAGMSLAAERPDPEHAPPVRQRAYHASLVVRVALGSGAPRERLAAAHASLATAFEDFLARWRARPLRPDGVGFLHWSSQRNMLSELVRAELALDPGDAGVERALATLVRMQTLGTLSRRLGAREPTLAEVRAALLPEGTGMLVYLPSMERSHLFGLDARSVWHAELAKRDVLRPLIDGHSGLVRTAPRHAAGSSGAEERERELADAAAKLAGELLPARAREHLARWRTVVIVGSELFGDVLLDALPLDDGEVLGLDRATLYMPSIPAGVALVARARAAGAQRARAVDLVLLASVDHGEEARRRWPGLAPFELDPTVVEALVEPFDAERVRRISHADASLAALRRPDVARARLLEVFTHGAYDPARTRPACLILSPADGDDGLCWAGTIDALDGVPDVVALFCCGSARGPMRIGDDAATHLASAYLARGSNTVVLSRGDVRLGAMTELARAFNSAWAEGAPPAEALRLGRRAVASTDSMRDPHYWALVSAHGVAGIAGPAPSAPARTSVHWIGLGLAVAAGAAAAALLLRHRRRARLRS